MKKTVLILVSLFVLAIQSYAQQYFIGHTVIVFNDAARNNRKIQTDVYYPAAKDGENTALAGAISQQFPLVVFAHGFAIAPDAYENIFSKLATQGFIVALPRTESGLNANQVTFAKDLAFMVNAMQGQSSMKGNLFTGRLNTKSCIMGHSMGGGCAYLAGLYNPTVTAIVALAPAETNPSAIDAASHLNMSTLILAGGNDCVTPANENSKAIYNASASTCKTIINITGGSHCQFANANFNCNFGESTCSPAPTISRVIQQSITMRFLSSWLNYKLKSDCRSWFIFEEELETAIDVTFLKNCTTPILCVPPSNKTTIDITANSCKLKWKAVSCVATYELRYKLSSTTVWTNIGTIGTLTGYTLTGLQSGTSYDWSVRTICDDDATLNSAWGSKKSFTTASGKDNGFESNAGDENEYSITPNPSNGKFLISSALVDLTPVSVLVYNCIGKKLSETTLKPKESDLTHTIDISNEPPGIYFVRINCGDQVNTQRIIKK